MGYKNSSRKKGILQNVFSDHCSTEADETESNQIETQYNVYESEKTIKVKHAISYKKLLIAYMQKTCDVAEKAILAKKKLRKKCVNRNKM